MPDRITELDRRVDGLAWKVAALEEWGRRVSAVETRIDEIEKDALIARAVAKADVAKVAAAGTRRYTRVELAVGSIVAGSALGSLILQAIGHT